MWTQLPKLKNSMPFCRGNIHRYSVTFTDTNMCDVTGKNIFNKALSYHKHDQPDVLTYSPKYYHIGQLGGLLDLRSFGADGLNAI